MFQVTFLRFSASANTAPSLRHTSAHAGNLLHVKWVGREPGHTVTSNRDKPPPISLSFRIPRTMKDFCQHLNSSAFLRIKCSVVKRGAVGKEVYLSSPACNLPWCHTQQQVHWKRPQEHGSDAATRVPLRFKLVLAQQEAQSSFLSRISSLSLHAHRLGAQRCEAAPELPQLPTRRCLRSAWLSAEGGGRGKLHFTVIFLSMTQSQTKYSASCYSTGGTHRDFWLFLTIIFKARRLQGTQKAAGTGQVRQRGEALTAVTQREADGARPASPHPQSREPERRRPREVCGGAGWARQAPARSLGTGRTGPRRPRPCLGSAGHVRTGLAAAAAARPLHAVPSPPRGPSPPPPSARARSGGPEARPPPFPSGAAAAALCTRAPTAASPLPPRRRRLRFPSAASSCPSAAPLPAQLGGREAGRGGRTTSAGLAAPRGGDCSSSGNRSPCRAPALLFPSSLGPHPLLPPPLSLPPLCSPRSSALPLGHRESVAEGRIKGGEETRALSFTRPYTSNLNVCRFSPFSFCPQAQKCYNSFSLSLWGGNVLMEHHSPFGDAEMAEQQLHPIDNDLIAALEAESKSSAPLPCIQRWLCWIHHKANLFQSRKFGSCAILFEQKGDEKAIPALEPNCSLSFNVASFPGVHPAW